MKLQHELKRSVPFVSLQQETLLNFLRIGDQVDNRLSRFFREHDLTLSRFNVLRALALAERPLTCGEIAERMIQIVPAITSLVDQLEKRGLVSRERSTEDRRVVHVTINPEGIKLSEETMVPLLDLEKQLLKKMTRAELKQLLELLEKARGSLADFGA
ncbi:MarR family winged helix-turn-helix transcriptional regulator [Neorhodopirellula lusitana]|uniref:MarR family winged helix-turn-helix transcriptional regulator n=1 Tax=Neorhodopirellula lusitana TaxID=445327 RepID=UPI0038509B59